MNDSEIKARLAQAEVHFSHYRWDAAMACFEAVLAAHPDHPSATQGWASAVEQKAVDEELADAVEKARGALGEQRFDEALRLLNLTQTRGALSQILKYHGEIDGLRSEAQEGQEWQRRVETAAREAGTLAARHRFEQALELLDGTLGKLKARGWEQLGQDLAQLRERLWGERDVSERVQFAGSALERQDYRLATELAAGLREELPDRDDVRRLHQRAAGAWRNVHERLAGVEQALMEGRGDEAIALLAALREEHPQNPEWQGAWLRVHMERGREDLGAGRSAMIEHRFTDAAEALERARAAFRAGVEVFAGHPTAAAEEMEALGLRDAALHAGQAMRDRTAFRWLASSQGWQASRERLSAAGEVRGRDFGDVAAVVDAMLGESAAIVADLDEARLMLANGQEALHGRDAGLARDQFRQGLARVDTKAFHGADAGPIAEVEELRRALTTGLREAERVQRDVKKLTAQAEAAGGAHRLKLLRQAYERWENAPGLAERLAAELLAAANKAFVHGDEAATAGYCDQIREMVSAPASVLVDAERLTAALEARRVGEAGLAEAEALIRSAETGSPPSAEGYGRAVDLLRRLGNEVAADPEVAERVETLRQKAQRRREQIGAAEPHRARSRALAEAGEWSEAASALEAADAALGETGAEPGGEAAEYRRWAEQVEGRLQAAGAAMERAEELYGSCPEGDLSVMPWEDLGRAVNEARRALKRSRALPARLPNRWEQMRARIEGLARRVETLREADERIRAGHGVEATPLLQSRAAEDGDPLVLAVLERLVKDTAGDAAGLAQRYLGEAQTALRRGELAEAESLLERARGYVGVAPDTAHQVRRAERQIAALHGIRAAVADARMHLAGGDADAALVWYRQALQAAAGGDAGLGEGAGQILELLLDEEDQLGGESAGQDSVASGAARIESAVQDLLASASGLTGEYLAPALRGWWKLAQRAAHLAFVEAQMTLGRDAAAYEAAARLVERYPRDEEAAGLYGRAASRRIDRLLSSARRGMARARRLAGQGSYEEALGQLDRLESEVLGPETQGLPEQPGVDELEAIRDELGERRHEWRRLRGVSSDLLAVVAEMRERVLAGEHGQALAAYRWARVLDPAGAAAAAWGELDQLAALVRSEEGGTTPGGLPLPGRGAVPAAAITAPPEQVVRVEATDAEPPPALPSEAVIAVWTGTTGVQKPAEPAAEARPVVMAAPEVHEPGPGTYGHSGAGRDEPEAATPRTHPEIAVEAEAPEATAPGAASEPPAPFDVDDWLSNVSELGAEDG